MSYYDGLIQGAEMLKNVEMGANFTKIDSLDELTNELKREIYTGY
ncbi:hypothetical protein HpNP123_15470 [Helicobacter pylori]